MKTIDIEPTWKDIFNALCEIHNISNDFYNTFLPCVETMDTIRQAQKQGKSRVIFEFTPDKKASEIIIE